uniref:Cadherin domain-containing protein n=1 Tax=Steinernema glaseri TaxID=37863 RepID=A0A1I7ZHC9_9BILA
MSRGASWVSAALLVLVALTVDISAQACSFPESELQPFFFDVSADTPPDSVLVDTAVEPPNATLRVVSVRSPNLPEVNFTRRFMLEKRNSGQFMVINKEPLFLPNYPSTVVETYLYMTVMCNKQAFPLITLRVRSGNSFKPRFYNAPYAIQIPDNATVGTVIPTSITAIDWDPADAYSVAFKIESGNDHGALELEIIDNHGFDARLLPEQFGENFTQQQLPPLLGIRVAKPLKQQKYLMRISATDETNYSLKNFATLIAEVVSMTDVVPQFSSDDYYASYSPLYAVGTEIVPDQPIVAVDGNETLNRQIIYFLEETEFSSLFYLDPKTARLLVKNMPSKDMHLGRSLTIQSYQADLPNRYATAQLWLSKPNGTSRSDEVAYFDPCEYQISIDENPPYGAVVATLRTHGNEAIVSLENGTSMLTLERTGEVRVTDRSKFDREKNEKLTFAASIQLSEKEVLKSNCPVATITVNLKDVNDNPPVFDRNAYHFKLENKPGNNTLVGVVKAKDRDKGDNAKISYSILNDENLFAPFYMYGPEIYYVQPDEGFKLDPEYILYVEALDNGHPRRAARVTVSIEVLPPGSYEDFLTSKEKIKPIQRQKKLKPQSRERFEIAQYAFSVYGRITDGQYVGAVVVPSRTMQISYQLEEKVNQLFKINSTNGHIYIDNSTMLNDYSEIRFAVTAIRKGKQVATCTVTVLLNESQSIFEVAPRFEQVLYRFKIAENTPPTHIGTVQAYHRAVELKKDKLNYGLSPSNDSNYFEIDQKSGELRTRETLDAESQKIYNLRVHACLGSLGSLCGHSDLTVMIEDVNDNAPVFQQPSFSLTVPHDLPVDSEVLNVRASDADSGKNAELSYTLLRDDETFRVDESSGQIFLNQSLTSMEPKRLVVEVTDKGTPPLSANATVVVYVGGSNPSAPEFDEFRYLVNKTAPVPVGSVLVQVHATDPDPGQEGLVRYALAPTDSPVINRTIDKFFVNPENGKISMVDELTEEDGSTIQLVVEAIDQSATFARKTQTVVSISVNYNDDDHVEFNPLPNTIYISVDKSPGSTILHAPARSAQNSELHYSVDQPGIDLFDMVGDSLVIKAPLPEKEYSITLRASTPAGKVGVHQIRIVAMKDRDKYPVFSQLTYQATINVSDGFPIKLDVVRATQAKGSFGYTLYPKNNITGVSIDTETGVITVEKEYLDTHGHRSPLFLVIRAINDQFPDFYSDAGVNIKLSDGTDVFSFPTKLYRMQIDDHAGVDTVLSTPIRLVNAEFLDNVTYSVEPSEFFTLDSSSRLKLLKALDPESLPVDSKGIIDIVVTAHQGDESTSTSVQVKVVSENGTTHPVTSFPQTEYSFSVDGQQAGEVVGTVAVSGLNGDVQYKKLSGDEKNYITVLENGTLVLNEQPEEDISIKIVATDSTGSTVETDVTISSSGNMEPTSEPGTFTPSTANPSAEPSSTESTTNTESTEPTEITIESSTITSTTTTASPEVSTSEPSTEPSSLPQEPHVEELESVNWTLPIDQPVENASFTFVVPNSQTKWTFSIPSGNDDNFIAINPINDTTAELQIIGAPSDLLQRDIVIQGVDQNNPNNLFQSNVAIRFPEKRSVPVFEAPPEELKVETDIPEEEPFYKVNASVPEGSEPLIFTLKTNPDNQFKIDPQTGEVSYAVDEARRKDGTYNLVVKAESGGQSSEITIPVEVEKPVSQTEAPTPSFGQQHYRFNVAENPQQEDVIGHLQVNGMTDPKDLIIRFEPDWANQVLTVDSTETIRLKHIPDDMLKNDFKNLKVVAENVQDPNKSASVAFSLLLPPPTLPPTTPTTRTSTTTKSSPKPTKSTSKKPKSTTSRPQTRPTSTVTSSPAPTQGPGPRFQKKGYRSTMLEGRYGGGTVLSLKPEPLRVNGIDKPFFAIDTSDSSLPFYIRNDTGQLIIVGDVDREQNPSYSFDVVASDPIDPKLQTRTTIIVTILDVNDNYPRFLGGPSLIAINDSLPMDTVIGVYEAVDDDEGPLGKVSYRIRNDDKKIFKISPSGQLKLAKSLESSNETFYDIIVEAMDGGRPALKTPYQVHIEVFSAVDVAPMFKDEMYEATVPVDAETGFVVTQLLAGTQNYSYELSDSYSQLFVVEGNGVVTLGRRPIESEQNRYKVLNVTARDGEGRSSTAQLNVFFEGKPIVVTVAPSTEAPVEAGPCQFTTKIFNAEIKENLSGHHNITRVTSNCEAMNKNVRYAIVQATKEFEIDELTGVVYVNAPLDREKRSTHFIIVNLTEVTDTTESQERNIRHTPAIHPIADFMKNKLSPGQSMIVLQVLDENDNAPTFLKVNRDGEYVFSIDSQVDPPNAVARVLAFDPDEKAKLTYNISENTPTDHFFMNETNGVLYLKKPLSAARYKFTAVASDGLHETSVPVWVYTISMENNIAVVVADKNRDDINDVLSSKKLSEMINAEVKIVDKKPYTDNQGNFDTQRSLLYVYALDKLSRVPLTGSDLKSMLSQQMDHLGASELRVSAVSLPVAGMKITTTELILLIICAILLFTACITLFLLVRFCKRRHSIPRNDDEYMVDSQSAGPRPYNVETISRQVAQNMLSSRPLPDPFEEHKAQIASVIAGPRSKNFSGDVQSIHTLIRSRKEGKVTGQSQPIGALNPSSAEHFPVYRSQGYGNCC